MDYLQPLITRGTESDRMWSFGLENGYVVFETTTGKMFTDSSCKRIHVDLTPSGTS